MLSIALILHLLKVKQAVVAERKRLQDVMLVLYHK